MNAKYNFAVVSHKFDFNKLQFSKNELVLILHASGKFLKAPSLFPGDFGSEERVVENVNTLRI